MNRLSDEQLIEVAGDELQKLLGIREAARCVDVARWLASMPQYHVGHLERVAAIEGRVSSIPGLALAGNAYCGVGIPQCIQSGEKAADKIIADLARITALDAAH
jgi:oxygen-dependent protoporphyrinogen oxidase